MSALKVRNYDLVIWGATGFTGRLAVDYIAKNYKLSTGLRWAIAGRDHGKLHSIKEDLNKKYGNTIYDVPILLASLDNAESLEK